MVRLGVALLVAATLIVPAAVAATEPILKVTARTPLAVEGHGFARGQRVRVTVWVRGVAEVRRPTVDPRGGFRVVFKRIGLVGARRCGAGVVISARTLNGRIVLWSARNLPDCPQPLRPPSTAPA
jgi:hypothetical protein